MRNEKFALGLIRKYHNHLLGYANRDVKMKKMLGKSIFMSFLWKHEVAQSIIDGKKEMKEIISTIKDLRKDYHCREF